MAYLRACGQIGLDAVPGLISVSLNVGTPPVAASRALSSTARRPRHRLCEKCWKRTDYYAVATNPLRCRFNYLV